MDAVFVYTDFHSLINKFISMRLSFLHIAFILALAVIGSTLSCASNQYYVNELTCSDCP